MKIAVLINLGDYNNIKIVSSEYDSIEECKEEINLALDDFDVAPIEEYQANIFWQMNKRQAVAGKPRNI